MGHQEIELTLEEFKLLFELRGIPQRNSHFMYVHGEERIAVAAGLVKRGLLEESEGLEKGDRTFRLNKPGREALKTEWLERGAPNYKDIFGDK